MENGPLHASELEGIPSGRCVMGFPVRDAMAVPFCVQTHDEAMFEDLAEMHLEKSGIHPEMGAGRLTDVFEAGREESRTNLLSVILSAPREGTMPLRAPAQFDISARFFAMDGDAITLWRELGRWVFAVTRGGKLAYFQALSGSFLSGADVRDIRLALTQLALQGVELDLHRAVIWTTGHESDATDDTVRALGEALEIEAVAEPKPSPLIPNPISHLVPADVRAEQRLRASKRKRNMIIAAGLLVYLGVAGFFGYQYYDLHKKHKRSDKDLAEIKTEYSSIETFVQDWNELAPVVEDQYWPLNNALNVSKAVPMNQDVRLKKFNSNGDVITVEGDAGVFKQATEFGQRLEKTLKNYEWSLPSSVENPKTKRWKFNYTAKRKQEGGV